MKLVQWHTLPPNVPDSKIDYITLDKTYADADADPELKTRLDEFVSYLKDRDFTPPQTFTELCYRYKDIYKEYPKFLSPAAVFVRVASIYELEEQVGPGWSWNRTTEPSLGPDCLGRPAKLWVNGGLQKGIIRRDPSHNWGVTSFGDTYACCGMPLNHPGCWKGAKKYEMVSYDFAPGFGERVWEFVKNDQWLRVSELWDTTEPRLGTTWLHDEKYAEWDALIRAGKASLKPAIIEALRQMRQLRLDDETAKLDPEGELGPLDKMTLSRILDLQERYNEIQCSSPSAYDLFRADVGNVVLMDFLTVFQTSTNDTWEAEMEEFRRVKQANPDVTSAAYNAYENYIQSGITVRNNLLSAIALNPLLQELPHYEPLKKYLKKSPSNAMARLHLNDIIKDGIDYNPRLIPKAAITDENLAKRVEVFMNFKSSDIDNFGDWYSDNAKLYKEYYSGFKGVKASFGMPLDSDLKKLYAQFILTMQLLGDNAADHTVALNDLDGIVFEKVQVEKQRLYDALKPNIDEATRRVNNWPSTAPPDNRFYTILNNLNSLKDTGSLQDFIGAIDTMETFIMFNTVNNYTKLLHDLKRFKNKGKNALFMNDVALKESRKDSELLIQELNTLGNDLQNAEKFENAIAFYAQLEEKIREILTIPTNAEIQNVVAAMEVLGVDPQLILDAKNARSMDDLNEIEEQAKCFPTAMYQDLISMDNDWPKKKTKRIENIFEKILAYIQEKEMCNAEALYDPLKVEYNSLLKSALEIIDTEALNLKENVSVRSRANDYEYFLNVYDTLISDIQGIRRYKPSIVLMDKLKRLYKEIMKTPTDEEFDLLIQKINDLQNGEIYTNVLDRAYRITTREELISLHNRVINIDVLTRDFESKLKVLDAKGHTASDLNPLKDIINRPKLSNEDIRNAQIDFKKAEEKIPLRFPVNPAIKFPKKFTYGKMQIFFKSIPPSGSDELDTLIQSYGTALLATKDRTEIANFVELTNCWKAIVDALWLFPKMRVDLLLKYLKGEPVMELEENNAVSDAIDNLRKQNCFEFVPRDFEDTPQLWIFDDGSFLNIPDPNIPAFIVAFLKQAQDDDRYNPAEFPIFRQFVEEMSRSNYAQNRLRFLKAADKCDFEFGALLNLNMENKPMKEIEIQARLLYAQGEEDRGFFYPFYSCMKRLENVWTFIWKVELEQGEDFLQPITISFESLEKIRNEFVNSFADEKNQKKWPKLYDFSQNILLATNEECLQELVKFLTRIEGEDQESVAELIESEGGPVLDCYNVPRWSFFEGANPKNIDTMQLDALEGIQSKFFKQNMLQFEQLAKYMAKLTGHKMGIACIRKFIRLAIKFEGKTDNEINAIVSEEEGKDVILCFEENGYSLAIVKLINPDNGSFTDEPEARALLASMPEDSNTRQLFEYFEREEESGEY